MSHHLLFLLAFSPLILLINTDSKSRREPYTPREPHYSAEEGRRRRQRNKLLELKKRGIIPWEEGDLMPDGRIKTGPKVSQILKLDRSPNILHTNDLYK